MGSVCKGSSSIGLMTGFSPAADNVPMVRPVSSDHCFSRAEGFKVGFRGHSESQLISDKMKYLSVGDLFLNKRGGGGGTIS